jgi:hypothetical protein
MSEDSIEYIQLIPVQPCLLPRQTLAGKSLGLVYLTKMQQHPWENDYYGHVGGSEDDDGSPLMGQVW